MPEGVQYPGLDLSFFRPVCRIAPRNSGIRQSEGAWAALEKLERSHVRSDPTGHLLIQRSLRIGVVPGSQHRHEQLCRAYLAGCWVVKGYSRSRPIDKQLLAWPMLLAQHQITLLPPALVVMAKTAVPIAVRMTGPVLFPQQLKGGVLVPLQFLMDMLEIGWRLGVWPGDGLFWK